MDWYRVAEIILSLVGGGIGLKIIEGLFNRPRVKSDAGKADADAALSMATAAKLTAETAANQVSALRRELEETATQLEDARATIDDLQRRQISNVKRITELEADVRNLTTDRNEWRDKWLASQRQVEMLTEKRMRLEYGIGKLIDQLERELNVRAVWRPEGTGPLGASTTS